MGLLPPKTDTQRVSYVQLVDGKPHWVLKDGGIPSIFEVSKFPHVRLGDIVRIVWRRHYGEETKLVVIDNKQLYDPREGF